VRYRSFEGGRALEVSARRVANLETINSNMDASRARVVEFATLEWVTETVSDKAGAIHLHPAEPGGRGHNRWLARGVQLVEAQSS